MTLTKREVSTLIRLLGVLQGELEISINSNTPAGNANMDRQLVKWRRDWRLAEELVKKLLRARRAKR